MRMKLRVEILYKTPLSVFYRKTWKLWGKQILFLVEKECIYIFFLDPDELKPKLLFFTLKEPISHYGDGI